MQKTKYPPYEGKEDDLQKVCAKYLAYHPEAYFCHVPNGGSRSKGEGAKFKAMGVRAGIPDLLIFNSSTVDGEPYLGLAIELKVKGGKLSEKQRESLDKFQYLGWFIAVCYSFDHFEDVIKEYFNEN